MIVEIKVPSVGESVTEAILAQWFKADGDLVKKGEALFVIETDKVTLEVESEAEGKLAITVAEGDTVAIGAVVGTIDTLLIVLSIVISKIILRPLNELVDTIETMDFDSSQQPLQDCFG